MLIFHCIHNLSAHIALAVATRPERVRTQTFESSKAHTYLQLSHVPSAMLTERVPNQQDTHRTSLIMVRRIFDPHSPNLHGQHPA